MTKKIYKTMQGRVIDLETIMARNETLPAVGNANMNARGDELGPGGKVIKTREEAVAEYYEDDPKSIPRRGEKKVAAASQSQETSKPKQEVKQEKSVQESKKNNEYSKRQN